MIFERKVIQKVNIRYLKVEIPIRDWDEFSNLGELIPGKVEGNYWKVTIDVDTGQIAQWSCGCKADVFEKVRDEGVYSIHEEGGRIIARSVNGYVPNMLCNDGDDDYLELRINEEGFIEDWNPDLNYFNL